MDGHVFDSRKHIRTLVQQEVESKSRSQTLSQAWLRERKGGESRMTTPEQIEKQICELIDVLDDKAFRNVYQYIQAEAAFRDYREEENRRNAVRESDD